MTVSGSLTTLKPSSVTKTISAGTTQVQLTPDLQCVGLTFTAPPANTADVHIGPSTASHLLAFFHIAPGDSVTVTKETFSNDQNKALNPADFYAVTSAAAASSTICCTAWK